jgi:hypothetical protein
VSSEPAAFVTLDRGGASVAAALVGRIERHWRLLGSLAAPASVADDVILRGLAGRFQVSDPRLADALGVREDEIELLPQYRARSVPPVTMAVLAGSDRSLAVLEGVAVRTGWRIVSASAESHDPGAMTELALGRDVSALLVGAGEPPAADERGALDELAALAGAVAVRRPELTVVLAGAIAGHRGQFPTVDGRRSDVAAAPAPTAGDPPGSELQDILERLRDTPSETRTAIVRAAATVSRVLDRRIEVLEIGFDGGLRAMIEPDPAGGPPRIHAVTSAEAALVPPEIDEVAVERISNWSTAPIDRYRMTDRLRELRAAPWSDAAGDGARLRLAAARAALARLVELTPDLTSLPAPDLTIVAGGAFAVAPGPAVVLAIADVIRRSGATQLASDHARVLGPLGTIDDDDARLNLLADLIDDILAPLGGVIIPAGLRTGRPAGRVVVYGPGGDQERILAPGQVEHIPLAPGEHAVAAFEFRDGARLGGRGRSVAVEVAGGVAGLLVDLRDVPLRLPDRAERRRDALAGWQRATWAEAES